MQEIPVYEMTAESAVGYQIVIFRRFHSNKVSQLSCQTSATISNHPLRIKVTIPPGSRIPDMQMFDGKEVVLVQEVQPISYLNNGE